MLVLVEVLGSGGVSSETWSGWNEETRPQPRENERMTIIRKIGALMKEYRKSLHIVAGISTDIEQRRRCCYGARS